MVSVPSENLCPLRTFPPASNVARWLPSEYALVYEAEALRLTCAVIPVEVVMSAKPQLLAFCSGELGPSQLLPNVGMKVLVCADGS